MKLVVCRLTISSSWGNGHATLWRGLCAALARCGVKTTFFERDVPYHAENRDSTQFRGVDLVLYNDWQDVLPRMRAELADAGEIALDRQASHSADETPPSDEVMP